MTVAAPTLLALPDWRCGSSDEAFAQWLAGLPAQRLEQDDERWPQRGDWLTRLDTTLRDATLKPVLIALGLGCAHWCSAAGVGGTLDAALTAQLNALLQGLATAPTDR